MAFISSSPPPMMPDDDIDDDIDEFGHLDESEDDDSAAFDLTGKLNPMQTLTRQQFSLFSADFIFGSRFVVAKRACMKRFFKVFISLFDGFRYVS